MKAHLLRQLLGDDAPVVVRPRPSRPARPVVTKVAPVRLSKVERLEAELAAETDRSRKVTIGLKLQAARLERDGAPAFQRQPGHKLGAAVVVAPDGRRGNGQFANDRELHMVGK